MSYFSFSPHCLAPLSLDSSPVSTFLYVEYRAITSSKMSCAIATLPALGVELILAERPIPKPGANQVLLKHRAVAINPIDWKRQQSGYFISRYPTVLGSDVCGVVEAVGDGVTAFQKGDRVLGYQARNPNEGAFQEYSILEAGFAAKIPDFMSFEEGALFPMAVATTGAALFVDLALPRYTEQVASGILVWGGSSSCGSIGVQMAKLLGFTVFSTASPKRHELVRSLGAKHVFDYKSTSVVDDILAAAKSEGTTINLVYDAIVSGGSSALAFQVLEAFGGGKYVGLLNVPQGTPVPKNIAASRTTSFRLREDESLGPWLFNDWLQTALKSKHLVPSPGIHIMEGGLASIQKAMDMNKTGVSGLKVVVPLS